MKNTILMVVALVILSLGVTSCSLTEGLFGEDTVFTTQDQLQEGEVGAEIPWETLPEDVKRDIPEGTVIVVAGKEQLKPDAGYISASPVGEGGISGLVKAGIGIASVFVPGIAAWEGVLTMLSQRKRKHWGKAIKAAVPMDKTVDLGGALASIGSALGVSHSSTGTALTFSDEEEELAMG